MDDVTGYTMVDNARIAVAERAAALADRLHELVGRHGHDRTPTEWLSDLAAPVTQEAGRLHDLVVAYARARGASWPEIASATGLDEAGARDRWQHVGVPVAADPGRLVADLEQWFIRRLWLDPVLAPIPDPLRRLLGPDAAPVFPSCLICRKYVGGPVPAWAGRADPPGGFLVDDELWRVAHAPTVFAPPGTLLVEARRHYLDFSEMNTAEATSYGGLIGRLYPLLADVAGAERVHALSTMDGAPHFHVWLFPRRSGDVKGRRFISDPGQSSDAEAADMIERMRALIKPSAG
jgi:diadenosine tetraphosphate (Ap4A) HIT family hydrolase